MASSLLMGTVHHGILPENHGLLVKVWDGLRTTYYLRIGLLLVDDGRGSSPVSVVNHFLFTRYFAITSTAFLLGKRTDLQGPSHMQNTYIQRLREHQIVWKPLDYFKVDVLEHYFAFDARSIGVLSHYLQMCIWPTTSRFIKRTVVVPSRRETALKNLNVQKCIDDDGVPIIKKYSPKYATSQWWWIGFSGSMCGRNTIYHDQPLSILLLQLLSLQVHKDRRHAQRVFHVSLLLFRSRKSNQ